MAQCVGDRSGRNKGFSRCSYLLEDTSFPWRWCSWAESRPSPLKRSPEGRPIFLTSGGLFLVREPGSASAWLRDSFLQSCPPVAAAAVPQPLWIVPEPFLSPLGPPLHTCVHACVCRFGVGLPSLAVGATRQLGSLGLCQSVSVYTESLRPSSKRLDL